MGLRNKMKTIPAGSVLNTGPISRWAWRTGVRKGWRHDSGITKALLTGTLWQL